MAEITITVESNTVKCSHTTEHADVITALDQAIADIQSGRIDPYRTYLYASEHSND